MEDSILESDEFQSFIRDFKIDASIFKPDFLKNQLRYIRLKSQKYTLLQLKEQIHQDIQATSIPLVYSLPNEVKINHLPLYQQGFLYGIDFSSASVVMALQPNKGENIVEICCAPGAKLCMIADLIKLQINQEEDHQSENEFGHQKNVQQKKQQNIIEVSGGSVIGVDISEHRMNTCKSLLNKYGHSEVKTELQDGCHFGEALTYDKVLVDAECTHDGSIKHILKFTKQINDSQSQKQTIKQIKQQKKQKVENNYMTQPKKPNEWSMTDFKQRFLDEYKLKQILDLQFQLLRNGFRILKNEGILIYSTCSFSTMQNESIIQKFMEELENSESEYLAKLLPPFDTIEIPCKKTYIPHAVRLDMQVSKSGGMFIAKLQKVLK